MKDSPSFHKLPDEARIPDSRLLEGWGKHQRNADFEELVRRHLGLVQGIASRQLDPDQAEDVAQCVFAILARKAATLTEVLSLGAWLHRVTLLQCRSAVRTRMRDRRSREAAMETARTTAALDPLADAIPHLDAAIEDLSETDRELILLRYSEGLTFKEAAKRTGRNEAALRQQASRAVEKLGGMLRRRGVSVPVATLTTGLGIHLAGSSSASAAALVANAALASSGSISGSVLAGITFLTMTAKQSMITGAVLAALLVTGPLVWRADQIHRAEKSLSAATCVPDHERDKQSSRSAEAPTYMGKTKSDRSPKPLSGADRKRIMAAIPGLLQASVKDSVNDWLAKDSELEATRMARKLGLSPETEKEFRDLLIAERTRMVDATLFLDDETVDRAALRRESDARIDAWCAAKLTPDQLQARKDMNETRNSELAEKLASAAVEGIGDNLDLTEEQTARLHEAASAKAKRILEENAENKSCSFGLKVLTAPPSPPVEEQAGELLDRILEPSQRELWNAAVERDNSFGENIQERVICTLFEQMGKVMPSHEEQLGSSEK